MQSLPVVVADLLKLLEKRPAETQDEEKTPAETPVHNDDQENKKEHNDDRLS